MFTGIIEQVGKVISVDDRRFQRRILVQTRWNDIKAGEQISMNGVTLTASADVNAKHEVLFVVSEENLERSALKRLEVDSKVNLERAMVMGSRVAGHFVQGTADTRGLVLNITEREGQHRLTIALDAKYGRYCVLRGWIAIEGMSLKIHALTETKLNEFMITCLISPQVWKASALSQVKISESVNVEVDVLAKYIERLSPQLAGMTILDSPPVDSVASQEMAISHEISAEALSLEASGAAATAEVDMENIEEISPEPASEESAEPIAELSGEVENETAAELADASEEQAEPVAELSVTDDTEEVSEPALEPETSPELIVADAAEGSEEQSLEAAPAEENLAEQEPVAEAETMEASAAEEKSSRDSSPIPEADETAYASVSSYSELVGENTAPEATPADVTLASNPEEQEHAEPELNA